MTATGKRRILILTANYGYAPAHGAPENAVREVTDRVVTSDIEFHAIALRHTKTQPETEWVGNVLVHCVGQAKQGKNLVASERVPLMFQIQALLKARQLHKTYHYTGLWATTARYCGITASLFTWLHKDVKYAQTLHESLPIEQMEKKVRWVWPVFVRVFTTPTVIQTSTNLLFGWAKRRGARCPVEMIPNGIALQKFSQTFEPGVIDGVCKQLGKEPDAVWLVHTGRYAYKNGIDTIIDALALLPENVHLLCLGDGPDEKKLKKHAKEKTVQNRVHFHPPVSETEVAQYLQACDIFVRPARSPAVGNAFVEAMVSAMPVVGTQEGDMGDFLFDEAYNPGKPPTGWVVRKDSPDEIASAVRRIIDEPEKVELILRNARAMVHERFDWDVVAQQMYDKVFVRILRDW